MSTTTHQTRRRACAAELRAHRSLPPHRARTVARQTRCCRRHHRQPAARAMARLHEARPRPRRRRDVPVGSHHSLLDQVLPRRRRRAQVQGHHQPRRRPMPALALAHHGYSPAQLHHQRPNRRGGAHDRAVPYPTLAPSRHLRWLTARGVGLAPTATACPGQASVRWGGVRRASRRERAPRPPPSSAAVAAYPHLPSLACGAAGCGPTSRRPRPALAVPR